MKKVFSASELAFLGVTCTVSLFLMVLGINGDCPITFEADEVDYAPHALWMLNKPTLNPEWFANPASTLYYPLMAYYALLKAIYGATMFVPGQDEMRTCYEHMDFLVKGPRFANVFITTSTLPLIYLIGRRWLGKGPAIIGTILYAVSPEVIRYSQILRTDMLSCFFVVLGMLLVILIAEKPRNTAYAAWVALVTALGTSTRYFCLVLVAPVVAAYGTAFIETKQWRVLLNALLFAILCPLFFFCISPFVILDFGRAVQDLRFEALSVFGGVTGLGFGGNLRFYLTDAMPSCMGQVMSYATFVGLAMVLWQRRNKLTFIFLVMLAAFFVGTCLNPRHWVRWLLPILPVLALLAGVAISKAYEVLRKLLQLGFTRRRSHRYALLATTLAVVLMLLEPMRTLFLLECNKLEPSGPALAWQYIHSHIPPGTKLALDLDWRWTGKWLYASKENIWRPDFIPPRDHNYVSPVDLAKDGFQYMIVEMWTRAYYTWGEPQNYQRESHFYTELRKHAPLIFTSVKHGPKVFGADPYLRTSPYEIYDLRPLAHGIANPNEVLNSPTTF